MSRLESIWREQAIPKREVAGIVGVSFRQSVKYENSSVDLRFSALVRLAQSGLHSVVGLSRRLWELKRKVIGKGCLVQMRSVR